MAEFQIDLKECLRIKKEFTAMIEDLRKCEERLYAVKDNISKMSGYKDMISRLDRECQAVTEERADVEKLLQTFSDCVQCYETAEKNVKEQEIDWHLLLDVAGLLPAVGAAFDGINTAWYAAEGDWSNALLSGLAFVPGIGEAVGTGKTSVKIGGKVVGHMEDAADIAKAAEKAGEAAGKAGKAEKRAGELGKYVDEAIEGGSTSAKGLIGHGFEDYLTKNIGGDGSFSVDGRDFDGGIGNRWWEAKSGQYWDILENNPNKLAKFKSDMGDRLRIATENGATYELFSNTPIPDSIKQWLAKKGITYTELLD